MYLDVNAGCIISDSVDYHDKLHKILWIRILPHGQILFRTDIMRLIRLTHSIKQWSTSQYLQIINFSYAKDAMVHASLLINNRKYFSSAKIDCVTSTNRIVQGLLCCQDQ